MSPEECYLCCPGGSGTASNCSFQLHYGKNPKESNKNKLAFKKNMRIYNLLGIQREATLVVIRPWDTCFISTGNMIILPLL